MNASNFCSFYTGNQFNDLCRYLPSHVFSTFHLNIRSLSRNYDNFIHYLSLLKHQFSIIALSETWLNENSREMFKLFKYNFVYYDRKNRLGGGVSLFIHGDYTFKIRFDLALKSDKIDVEHLFVELLIGPVGRNIIVGVIYRAPDSSIQDFNDTLASLLDLINNEQHKYCCILGDFNINLLRKKFDTPTADFLNILYSSYYFPLIHKPTSVKENTETLIDNILTNSLSEGIKSGVLCSDLSDHFHIFHYSEMRVNRVKQSKEIKKKRIMSKLNIYKYLNLKI